MKVQVLVATMHQKDYTLLNRLNLQSDAVIVNQCDNDSISTFAYKEYNIVWINSVERGLSRSRNMALENADADICVICDDDEILSDGYPKMIENAYTDKPKADFIAFNINRIGWNETEKMFTESKKIGHFKTYSSVHITFRLCKVRSSNIVFNVNFGAGSGMYACAEDAIFCMDCHTAGMVMYTYPGIICDVNCEESTWFSGYSEKYFYDVGAYLSVAFPCLKSFLKWYYPIRCKKVSKLSAFAIIKAINSGIAGYKKNLNFEQYKSYKNK